MTGKYLREELPQTLTLLPVYGAVLMPRSHMPVPIFDIDYINTLASSIKEKSLIGVVQPAATDDEALSDSPLYTAGTLAKITSVEEVEDGKMMATLEGVCRFDVIEELPSLNGYRRAEVCYDSYFTDLAEEVDFNLDRPRLLKALGKYFKNLDVKPNWKEIDKTSNEKLITALVMVCPFEANEKQALLESPTFSEQSEVMTKLIEFAATQDLDLPETLH